MKLIIKRDPIDIDMFHAYKIDFSRSYHAFAMHVELLDPDLFDKFIGLGPDDELKGTLKIGGKL